MKVFKIIAYTPTAEAMLGKSFDLIKPHLKRHLKEGIDYKLEVEQVD